MRYVLRKAYHSLGSSVFQALPDKSIARAVSETCWTFYKHVGTGRAAPPLCMIAKIEKAFYQEFLFFPLSFLGGRVVFQVFWGFFFAEDVEIKN